MRQINEKTRHMESGNKYLERRFGKGNPFIVPEGYFESMESRVISRLPDKEIRVVHYTPTLWKRYRYAALSVAACICAAVFGAVVYLNSIRVNDDSNLLGADFLSGSSYIDCVADYAMIDNEDIYAYVSEY